jgi:hypothetical protein
MIVTSITEPGGAGKTTTALAGYEAFCLAGRTPLTGEIERHERKFSRMIAAMFPGREQPVDISIRLPDADALRADPRRSAFAYAQFFRLMERGHDTDASVDTAAGVGPEFLQVAEDAGHAQDVDGGRHLAFLVPTSPTDSTHTGAARRTILMARRVYPAARIVAVMNRAPADEAEVAKMERSLLDGDVRSAVNAVVVVPVENSGLTTSVHERLHIPHSLIRRADVDTIMRMSGLDRTEARLAMRWHRDWHDRLMIGMSRALQLGSAE